jgi:L-ascorbate metabolism protein UlaG (beta-lactamase superfamily)
MALADNYMKYDIDISVALLNTGKATAPLPTGPLQITLDGAQAARLFRELGADVLVPMHFESWRHFAEEKADLRQALEVGGVMDKVMWLEPGVRTTIV